MSVEARTFPVPAVTVICGDCWEGFGWDSSPDLDRCQRCAEVHAWHEGTADPADQVPWLFVGCDLREV